MECLCHLDIISYIIHLPGTESIHCLSTIVCDIAQAQSDYTTTSISQSLVDAFDHSLTDHILSNWPAMSEEQFLECRRLFMHGSFLDRETKELLVGCNNPAVLQVIP
jgi:hypothetical protein